MAEQALPLVNSSMLAQNRDRTVQLVGKVEKISGQTLMLKTSDQGIVEVMISEDSVLDANQKDLYVTIIGRVDKQGESVQGFRLIELGKELNLDLVDQCVQLQPKFPALFAGTSA